MKKKKTTKKLRKNHGHGLAAILILTLIVVIEFGFFTAPEASSTAINDTFNLSNPLQESVAGLVLVAQPGIEAFQDVTTFYQIAATEMAKLLDMSEEGEELMFLFKGMVAGASTQSCSQ